MKMVMLFSVGMDVGVLDVFWNRIRINRGRQIDGGRIMRRRREGGMPIIVGIGEKAEESEKEQDYELKTRF